jgi:hypothetical protein
MLRKKLATVSITALLLLVPGVFAAAPAISDQPECPQDGWMLVPDPLNATGEDDNGDGQVCVKQIPGDGGGNSVVDNFNAKDNN